MPGKPDPADMPDEFGPYLEEAMRSEEFRRAYQRALRRVRWSLGPVLFLGLMVALVIASLVDAIVNGTWAWFALVFGIASLSVSMLLANMRSGR
jgi:hypothetical protein